MQLVNAERPAHFYKAAEDGTILPYYEMRGKNGKMRAPNIADAREQNLLVSISRIAGMLPKPRLTAWLQSQAIISALTLPRLPNESTDVFAKRVVEDMEAQSSVAMEFGSRIHAQIEQELISPGVSYSDDTEPFMKRVRIWLNEQVSRVIAVEKIVGDERLGIGGKLDLLCELNMPGNPVGLIDFKTQTVKNGSAAYYPEWFIQLAGYGQCIKQQGAYEAWPTLISVVIDSKQPGPVHFKTWENPEYGWEIFLHCLEIFCYVNDYRPGKI